MTDEPRLQAQPRGGVPGVTDTLEGFREVCDRLAGAAGPLAADAERASGFRYGHEDWLVQFKREGAGIVLLDPVALTRAGADWGMFNDAVGDAVWILHDSLQDLPGFADIGLTPQALFDTEIAARMLGLHRFGLAAVTEHYLGVTLAKEHSAADWSYRPLPRDWRNYAALDVELLIELRRKMQRELKVQGKDGWADEEFRYALQTGMGPRREHPVPWLRISHINTVSQDHQGLAVAKALWEKRDELARAYDIAPGLLLSDDSIVEAASRKPRNAREFRMIRSLNERVRMRTGGEQDAEDTGEIRQGPFRLNTRNRTLEKNGERVRLTQIEFSIIKYFMDNPGKALSREDILNEVWGRDYFGELKIVDVNIRRLRIKIEDDPTMPAYITTVWGYGYKWGL